MPSAAPDAWTDLTAQLHRAGYYPELVADVLDVAVAGEEIVSHLVLPETTFDASEVRRHLTVLVLTPSRLVTSHVDDHPADSENPSASAAATTESVPLAEVRSVSLTHVVAEPQSYHAGTPPLEVTLALGWGAVSRVDLEPAQCPDPSCDADHGLTGQITPDDVVVRVSAEAEGSAAVRAAVDFARALSRATAYRTPR
ncbi:phosphodiesterase [Cellulosimicrobium terreum]|nr:phosphodiesterase [Cellulosimicrobium terreum]